jgi:hypothetical protein
LGSTVLQKTLPITLSLGTSSILFISTKSYDIFGILQSSKHYNTTEITQRQRLVVATVTGSIVVSWLKCNS